MKTIEILILPDGKISLDLSGFQGLECEEATRELIRKLGTVEQETRKTDAWYGKVKGLKQKNGSV